MNYTTPFFSGVNELSNVKSPLVFDLAMLQGYLAACPLTLEDRTNLPIDLAVCSMDLTVAQLD